MEISAIGGGLTGGGAMQSLGGATQPLGGATATTGTPSTATLDGIQLDMTLTTGLQSLMDVMGEFTSAQILIALMLMAAADKDDDDSGGGGGGAALGFLAGLALAGQIGGSSSAELNVSIAAPEGVNLGGQLDLTA